MKKLLVAFLLLWTVTFPLLAEQVSVTPVVSSTFPQYYATASESSIRALAAQVCANSTAGGFVNIPGGTITLTQPLQTCSGLRYIGAPPQADISAGQTGGVGGTIFQATISTISSGTYNSGTGVITLTMSSSVGFGMGVGVALYSLTGTGAFANLNTATYCALHGPDNCNWTTIATTSGTTVTIQGPTGLGAATITGGSLTFDGIDYNNADLSSPPGSGATFIAGMLSGFGAINFNWTGFANAIRIGGKYNPGCKYCKFDHNIGNNNQLWAAWFENLSNSEMNVVYGTNNKVGQVAEVGSGAGVYNTGNNKWFQTETNNVGTGLARNLVSWTRGGGSNLTQESHFADAPSQGFVTEVVQVATMSNASCNITVTDGSKFPLDMPTTTDATQNGFTTGQTYFVASNSGANVITLANTMRGSCITPSSSTAVNLKTKGFPVLEVVALDNGGFIGYHSYGIDVEGSASAQIVLQGITEDYFLSFSLAGGDNYKSIVRRSSSKGYVFSNTATTFDDDSTSNPNEDHYYDGSNIHFHMSSGGSNPGVNFSNGGNFDYGISNSGRWTVGGNTFSGSSMKDIVVESGPDIHYAYRSQGATATNGNVGMAMQQGNGNGGAGNEFCVIGIIGTNSDSTYGLSTSQSSRASGDAVFQCYNGSFANSQAWWVPTGTTNIKFAGNMFNPGITADTGKTDATVCEDTTNHQFFSGTGTLGICLGTSSLRYKRDVRDLDVGLDEIMKLKAKQFKLDADHGDPNKIMYGFAAEEGIDVLPNLAGVDNKGKPNTFDYLGVVPVLVKAMQEQQREIEHLKKRIQ